MGLRKGHCYTTVKRAYTRKSKVKSKSYIKTIPPSKIARFEMGDVSGFYKGKYSHFVILAVTKPVQIRDNALEAARQYTHRQLEERLKGNFYFVVNAYPHHILRENKMLTGAGADRMQTGMSHCFGKPIGIAAQLTAGGKIFSVACNQEAIPEVREAFRKIKAKLPGEKTIIVEQIKK
ncbi:MAG: 50S ribosomal protein L16 [Candidatus Pacearchaeota archaeon]|nr:50S ribosomal protein L16 [Candidatus Pacearchaeota archaeon]